MVAEEEVRDLPGLAVLPGEPVPQPGALGDVVTRFARVAQPHAVGLVLAAPGVAVRQRHGPEGGQEIGDGALVLVVHLLGGHSDAQERELDPHLLLERPPRVLVGGVGQLLAQHDGHLVVVHVVEEPREDVHGEVAHGGGVPLLVVGA